MANSLLIPNTKTATYVTKVDESQRVMPEYYHNSYSVNKVYINHTGRDLVIVERNGIQIRIPSTCKPATSTASLIVRYIYTLTGDLKFNVNDVCNDGSDYRNRVEVEALKEVLKDTSAVRTSQRRFMVDYNILESDLIKNGWFIYYENIDVCVTTVDQAYKCVHPNSKLGLMIAQQNYANELGFNFSVVINDPRGIFGARYVNLNGWVYKVEPTIDEHMEEGVYITASNKSISGFENSERIKPCGDKEIKNMYTFEEADELIPLWTSARDAKNFGDAIFMRDKELKLQEQAIKAQEQSTKLKEQELKNAEQEIKREEQILRAKYQERNFELEEKAKELENEKLNLKKTVLDRESEITKLKAELDRAKVVNDIDKTYYDNRRQQDEFIKEQERYRFEREKQRYDRESYSRKNASEWYKMIPQVVIAISGIVTAGLGIMKLMKGV